MKICLVGDFSGTPDEGMKNISHTLKRKLSKKHDVVTFGLRELLKPSTLREIRKFSPEILHYLHGPTIRSLIILKLTKHLLNKDAKIVVSATRPYFPRYLFWLIPYILPNLLLTQSQKFEKFFLKLGANASFIPNGVDCEKFKPANMEEVEQLKLKYNIPPDQLVVLHVGHIKVNRQLDVFKRVQEIDGVQVVIVGGTVQAVDEGLKSDLLEKGVIVIHQYLEDISEIYNLSDIYVFPIIDIGEDLPDSYNQVGAIDLPLSVFEAMSCNKPIVTTRFGALERLFNQGEGFDYIENESEIISCITNYTAQDLCKTRDKVIKYDWDKIILQVEEEYCELIKSV